MLCISISFVLGQLSCSYAAPSLCPVDLARQRTAFKDVKKFNNRRGGILFSSGWPSPAGAVTVSVAACLPHHCHIMCPQHTHTHTHTHAFPTGARALACAMHPSCRRLFHKLGLLMKTSLYKLGDAMLNHSSCIHTRTLVADWPCMLRLQRSD